MRVWRALFLASALLGAYYFGRRHFFAEPSGVLSAAAWQHLASPGALSQGHAFLEHDCAACHTPMKGVEAKNCIFCHADNSNVLKRQPTAFHADITECAACHREHQGRAPRTTKMDHVALARIGIQYAHVAAGTPDQQQGAALAWVNQNKFALHAPQLQAEELLLDCAVCHQTKDRHRGLFGTDCAQCHGTTKWTISDFQHPSSVSQSCAQCHQAPPSHYMEHFRMISMKVAHEEHAEVSECFKCHQTTSWNDIQGVGFYKHH